MSVFPSTLRKSMASTLPPPRTGRQLISRFSSFPHIYNLQILGVQSSKKDIRDVVASLPNLRFLTLMGSSPTQGSGDCPQAGRELLPHYLETLRLLFHARESAPLDLIDRSGYPAKVQGLEMVTLHGHELEDNDIASCNDAVVQRIHAFLYLLVTPPKMGVPAIQIENNIQELMIEFELNWYMVPEILPEDFTRRGNPFESLQLQGIHRWIRARL